jgi:exonuclease SbcC
MLISLKLKNFKKHEDLSITFTEGLNVIRGNNENGKSTLVQAIAYALYGARALPMSLDETVTWYKPVSSLKVELCFEHDAETYVLTRSKSGAELVGTTVKSSGHTEVTAFIERLFNATAAVGQATMLTNQSALQEGLSNSSTSLIEKLANMALIDELVGKIQDQLPTGSTKLLESRLASVAAVEAPEPIDDTLEDYANELLETAKTAKENVEILEQEVSSLQPLASEIQARIRDNAVTESRVARLKAELGKLPETVDVPQAPDLENLESLAVKQAEQRKLLAAWQRFCAIPYQNEYHGTTEDFVNSYKSLEKRIEELKSKKQDLEIQLAGLKPLLITETVCGLCDKDLSNVPEVADKNSKTRAKIEAISADIRYIENELVSKRKTQASYKVLERKYDEVERLVGIDLVKFDMAVVPPKAEWLGGTLDVESDYTDYSGEINKAKKLLAKIQVLRQEAASLESKRDTLQKQINEAEYKVVSEADNGILQNLEKAKEKLEAAITYSRTSQASAAAASAEAYKAKVDYDARAKAHFDTLKLRDSLQQTLAEYGKNNALLKKLREARPIVAKQLWSIVLTAVSHYFSEVRGVQSSVGREGSTFTIDGKSVEAYSGSTKDALALAVRVVLQKTFLPNIDFALFDEVASACDDSRESEMLAMLSTCGLRQVLLVTHSNLADSYAANVICI